MAGAQDPFRGRLSGPGIVEESTIPNAHTKDAAKHSIAGRRRGFLMSVPFR